MSRFVLAAWCNLLVLAAALLAAIPLQAEQPPAPELRAAALAEAPALDGNVLEDPVWQALAPIAGFWQTAPYEGQPASEKTEVRVGYTATTLYVGVVCFDRDPDGIIISDSRRDAALNQTDSFRFILDTYRDRQNGFVFGTNPAGIEYDGQVTNEGQGGDSVMRQASGSGGGFNINWDGSWEVRTQIGAFGWSAEFAIPFRTLRFGPETVQSWGINFERTIRRRNEIAFWSQLPRQYNLYRVSAAGTLHDVQVPASHHLQMMPYGLARASRDYTLPDQSAQANGDFGLDAKYGVTSSLTLDLTINTDFAQVEVDEQQVNLDRFSLFFPEKRAFFLENAGLFSIGMPEEIELFFSRRIGIGPQGEVVPILAGARLTGDAYGLKLGVLNMQTDDLRYDLGGGLPSNNFTVARVKRELPNRSAIGVLFTNRQGFGGFAADQDFNRLWAADAQLGIGRYGLVSGFLAGTQTPGVEGSPFAFMLDATYNAEALLLQAGYAQVAAAFNPEMGFLHRQAYRKPSGRVMYRYRPADFLGLMELRPHVSYFGYWTFDGFQETGYLHVDNHWEWRSGYEIHTGINFRREGVVASFPISEGVVVPAGTYDHREAQLVGMTDQGKWISLSVRSNIGGFFGGHRISTSSTLRVRAGETFTTEFGLSRNMVDLPGGNFDANLFQGRLSYAFSPRIYMQSLLQYNDQADLWSANLRFGWLQEAGTGFFVVFNQANYIDALLDGRVPEDSFLGRISDRTLNRSFTIKYSRLLNVLP